MLRRSNRARRAARPWSIMVLTAALVLTVVMVAAAHDMFLKPTRYFAPENAEVRVRVLNGTFTKSENSIARSRLADVSVVTPTRRMALDTSEWSVSGDTTTFHVHTRGAGTYVIGASTRPNVIALSADDFNLYLKDDGIPDVLAARQQAGEMVTPARERYHKHVKAIIQVGDARSDHYATALGYPAEIVPLENPYALSSGSSLRVKTLVDGQPVANQLLTYGGVAANDSGIEPRSVRSDGQGVARIQLSTAGDVVHQIHQHDPGAGRHRGLRVQVGVPHVPSALGELGAHLLEEGLRQSHTLGLAEPVSCVLDPEEAAVAGALDDRHHPPVVDLGLVARVVEVVGLALTALANGISSATPL